VSAGVVIERGRNPVLRVVAVAAVGPGILGHELPVVRVVVASFALLRGALESRGIIRRRLVTIAANDGAMRAQQWKLRSTVVKSIDVRPGFGRVASLAAEWGAVRPFSRHAVVEFSLVGILVACRACPIFESERQNFVIAAGCTKLVAVDASNRRVRAG